MREAPLNVYGYSHLEARLSIKNALDDSRGSRLCLVEDVDVIVSREEEEEG